MRGVVGRTLTRQEPGKARLIDDLNGSRFHLPNGGRRFHEVPQSHFQADRSKTKAGARPVEVGYGRGVKTFGTSNAPSSSLCGFLDLPAVEWTHLGWTC